MLYFNRLEKHLPLPAKGAALLILILLPIYIGSSLWEHAYWNSEANFIRLNNHFKFYQDPTNSLEIDQVLKKTGEDWTPPPNEKMNFGFRPSTVWLQTDFQAAFSDEYILELPYSLLKVLDVYAYIDGVEVYQYQTGVERSFSSRAIAHRNYLFPLEFKQDQQVSIYLKVRSDGFLKLPAKIWRKEIFYKKDQITNFVQGAYFGVIAVVIIYNLLAFLTLVNITQLWFVIYAGLFFLFQFSMQGFGHQYLWPDTVQFQNASIVITMISAGLISCFFAHSFLDLKRSNIATNALLVLFGLCMVTLLVIYPSVPYTVILQLQILIQISLALVFISIGIIHWRRGGTDTAKFIFAWLLLVLSILFDGVEKLGLVSNLAVLLKLTGDIEMLQLISVIEVILLSFALGDKISLERKKGIQAQQEVLRIKSEQTELLEINVNKRTQELQEALKELALVNEKLNSQNNTDSLTGTYNRRFFIEYFEQWVDHHNGKKLPFSLVLIDLDNFKKINDNYGHLFGDQCLITTASVMKEHLRDEGDCLCRYGGEEFALLLPETASEAAQEIAERLRQAVQDQIIRYDDVTSSVTISVGVSSLPMDERKNSKWLFEITDQALYRAKETGRNRVVVHSLLPQVYLE